MRSRLLAAPLALVALAALIAACGGDGEPPTAAVPSGSGETASEQVPVEPLPDVLPDPFIIRDDGGAGEEEAAQTEILYTVQPGDTLALIAERFDVTSAEIQRINGIADPSLLRAGDELRIPVPEGAVNERIAATTDEEGNPVDPDEPPPGEPYEIQPGDTLYDIAVAHGVDYLELQRYNNLSDFEAGSLTVGDTIIIPPAEEDEAAEEQEPPG